MKQILIVGATGDVGKGITGELLAHGYGVIAAGRNNQTLQALVERHAGQSALQIIQGSIENETTAEALRDAVTQKTDRLDGVVVSVNAPLRNLPLFGWTSCDLLDLFNHNLMTHFVAAKTFIPSITEGGLYLAIGGGMADFVMPGSGHSSMVQAAQRMMLRYLARENQGKAAIRELIIASIVAGDKKREGADPKWITDAEVGMHVRAILENLASFAGPILTLKSKKQIGQPEIPST